MVKLFSPVLFPPCYHTLPLFFLLWLSRDQAILADRRRVGSINRNWTNYKADVPLYDGGRELSGKGEGVCGTFTLSELLFPVVWLSVSEFVFVSFVWLPPAFSFPHHDVINPTPPFFHTKKCFFIKMILLSITSLHDHMCARTHKLMCMIAQPTFLNKSRRLSLIDSLVTDCGI